MAGSDRAISSPIEVSRLDGLPKPLSLSSDADVLHPLLFTRRRPAHAVADLGGVHLELRQGAAERVPMHSKFFSSLALIALVMRENFKDVASFELAKRIGVGDTGAVHLEDQTVQFALQWRASLAVPGRDETLLCSGGMDLIQMAFPCLNGSNSEPKLGEAMIDALLQGLRYNEGYPRNRGKEIGSQPRSFEPRKCGQKGCKRTQ